MSHAVRRRPDAVGRAVLAGIFPGRPVACALVWTAGPLIMPLPDSLLDLHAPGAASAGQGAPA